MKKENKFLLGILAFVILLRIPSLFEPYWYGDEGVYLTLGLAIRKGFLLYRDIHDNKPPFLYLLAALAGNLFWFKFILLVFSLFTVYIFNKFARALFENNQKKILLATIFFALLSSLPLIEGNIANAEIFLLPFTISAFFPLFSRKTLNPKICFGAGILFSLATLLKMPAVFDFLAALFFFSFFSFTKKDWSSKIKNGSSLIFGFCVPLGITFLYFWFQGASKQFLTAAFLQNIGYLSSWKTGVHSESDLPSGLLLRGIFMVVATALIWLWRRRWSPAFSLISLWLLFSLFGATLSGRPYPHYLLAVLPAFSLLLPYLVLKVNSLEKKIAFFLFLTLTATIFSFHFWFYPVFSYYNNFLQFSLGRKNQEAFFLCFNKSVPKNYQVSEFIAQNTQVQERIFVWGDEPFIYALSRRLPAGKYITAYHIIDFNAYKETAASLEDFKPKFIVKIKSKKSPFPELEAILGKEYLLVKTIGEAEIFRFSRLQML